MQIIEAFLPKELAVWAKLILSVLLSIIPVLLLNMDNPVISVLAVATVAGSCHTVLRLATLSGDLAFKKTVTR